MSEARQPIAPSYLGDGVYAAFDGFHIVLRVGHHEAPQAVALDPDTIRALADYAKAVNAHYGVNHFQT